MLKKPFEKEFPETTSISGKVGLFKSLSNNSLVRKEKLTPEERLAIEALRRVNYPKIEEKLKKELGDEYKEQDAEEVFKMFIQAAKEKGMIQDMIKEYRKKGKELGIKEFRGSNSRHP